MEAPAQYESLLDHVRRANLLVSTEELLHWDQETMMPPARGGAGAAYRGRQLAQLASLAHRMWTDPRLGEWLAVCEQDERLTAEPDAASAVNLREVRREYEKATKLPNELVEELTAACAEAHHAWAEARNSNDFAAFRPHLERIVELSRRKADCYGWPEEGERWDALADDFEPGMTASGIAELFGSLRGELVELIGELRDDGTPPDGSFLSVPLPVEKQKPIVRRITERVGFDFDRGRLDESAHPFTAGTHRNDIRLTTRYAEGQFFDALAAALHEAGHGMYEQRLPGGEHVNTPMGRSVSLGIHESQALLIENHVARSEAFWRWCGPVVREHFGAALDGFSDRAMYGAANRVEPGLIRVEADEATYNLHIMARFELERAMLRGDLSPAELPGAWTEKYRDYLGVDVPDDARGCLQDDHWSQGAFGYFPTYALGTLYAAQFFEQARLEVPEIGFQMAQGQFAGLVNWLGEQVHGQGMRYRPAELCHFVTGRHLETRPLLEHLRTKLKPLYGLSP